jgi:hypothetical protein
MGSQRRPEVTRGGSLSWVSGGRIGDDHGEVLARPDHFGVQAGGGKPPDLVVDTARPVVYAVDWCNDVGQIIGDHDVAEHEPSARLQPVGDAGEQVRLTRTVEVVHGERRYDKVKLASRQWILETAYAQVGGGMSADAAASIPALSSTPTNSASGWRSSTPTLGLPRAPAKLEHSLGVDPGSRLGDGGLQLVVRRHLRTDRLEVAGRIEVELVTVGWVDHRCSLAGTQQSSDRLSLARSFLTWSAISHPRVARGGRRS